MPAVNLICFYAPSSKTDFVRNRNLGGVANVAIWNMASIVVHDRETTTRTKIKNKKITKYFVQNEGT
jgi:hypothetical protein